MKELIPLVQTLVWPVFLGVLLYIYRRWFREILNLIKARIEEGGEFNLGPTGFVMGAAPKLPDNPDADDIIDDGSAEISSPELLAREEKIEQEKTQDPEKSLQLVHRTSYLKIKNNRRYYRVVVSLDSSDPLALARVERVVYYLHPTFRNPVRESTDSRTNFALKTAAWGEFTIHADIFFKEKSKPLHLSRYITIQTIEQPYEFRPMYEDKFTIKSTKDILEIIRKHPEGITIPEIEACSPYNISAIAAVNGGLRHDHLIRKEWVEGDVDGTKARWFPV